jgi:hypothetical protein
LWRELVRTREGEGPRRNHRALGEAHKLFDEIGNMLTEIRRALLGRDRLSAAVELRRRFPGITDNAQAPQWARTIAGWGPLRSGKRTPKPLRL